MSTENPIEEEIYIRDLERVVYQQDFETAGQMILKILTQAEKGGGMVLHNQTDVTHHMITEYTRLASAFTAFFANSKLSLSFEGFQAFARFKKHLVGIFQVSGFSGTDHVIGLIGNQAEKGKTETKFTIHGDQQVMKFLILYSLYSEVDIDFGALLRTIPKLAMPIYLNLVAEKALLNQKACDRRDKLLELGPQLENMSLHDGGMLVRLSNLWMYCSYADGKNKHDIKKHLNVVIRNFLNNVLKVKVPSLPSQRKKKDRPVLLIVLERFTANHAMYRCYAPLIGQLREKFHLVLMCVAEERDDVNKKLFDEFINVKFEFADEKEVKRLVRHVVKLEPDMIYYPSLGMSQWTLLLANLRLAPIQFMTAGHPATSHSPVIDYFLMPEILYSRKVDCFSEKVVLMETSASVQMVAPHGSIKIEPKVRKNPAPLRLAVTSTSLKLNAVFMAVCKRILESSEKEIEFHFFPNEIGMLHQIVKQRILEWIPDAKVYPRNHYNIYLENLNRCDIHLSPFPFGGTNSNVDSIRQGLPLVTLEGDQPHSRTDSVFHEVSNLPDWLLVHSQDEYVEAALRLINNEEERVAISENLLKQDFDKLFLDSEIKYHDKVFGKTVEYLYEHHEDIQEDGKKVWSIDSEIN